MYPQNVDAQHRAWIKDLIHVQGGHPDPVGQLVISAYECAVSILQSAGATSCNNVAQINAYQLDLFLFKDMGLGGALSKFISSKGMFDILRLPGSLLTTRGICHMFNLEENLHDKDLGWFAPTIEQMSRNVDMRIWIEHGQNG